MRTEAEVTNAINKLEAFTDLASLALGRSAGVDSAFHDAINILAVLEWVKGGSGADFDGMINQMGRVISSGSN